MSSDAPLLRVHDLRVSYRTRSGAVPAVRGVSFDLAPAETLGLAGESGCGKSTLAYAILRLLPKGAVVEGTVELNGQDVYAMKPGQLRAARWSDMAVVFQGALHTLNPVIRVGSQVGEAIELHEQISGKPVRARVEKLFEQVGLPAKRVNDFPHQLSGGQRQRVMIAMALACNPHLLIADEPTTALDVMVQAQVLELLADLQRDLGLAMIFITHDLSVLTSVCERLAVMYAGKIIEEGPGKEVFAHAAHPYTRALVGAFPTVGDPKARMAPSGLGGDPPDPTDVPSGCSFHPRCPDVQPECSAIDVELWAAPTGGRAACIEVQPGRANA